MTFFSAGPVLPRDAVLSVKVVHEKGAEFENVHLLFRLTHIGRLW